MLKRRCDRPSRTCLVGSDGAFIVIRMPFGKNEVPKNNFEIASKHQDFPEVVNRELVTPEGMPNYTNWTCQDVERAISEFWLSKVNENLASTSQHLATAPVYLDAVTGSLFPPLDILPHANPQDLKTGLKDISYVDDGNKNSSVFLGEYGTVFAAHKEEHNLFAFNIHLGGYPKVWYVIPESQEQKFEKAVKEHFRSTGVKKKLNNYYVNVDCEYLVYHKMHLFSPEFLARKGIEFNRLVQFPGEVIITNAIHFGVNLGKNINEAANFVLDESSLRNEAYPCQCQD